MKLHWSPRSPFVRKVMVTAHELGLTDRLELVRTAVLMDAPNPALQSDNPLGKIPTLVLDDGTVLFDSLTICLYLNELAGGTLVPQKGPPLWAAMTWHALGSGLLDTLILYRNERDKPIPHQPWLEAFLVKAAAALDRMEALVPEFEAAPFAIGQLTVALVPPYIDFRLPAIDWRQGRPRLAAWHETMARRPSMVATAVRD